jgi:hypothetical protein
VQATDKQPGSAIQVREDGTVMLSTGARAFTVNGSPAAEIQRLRRGDEFVTDREHFIVIAL